MAKELPYYKFEPNEWENGNIQMCTHEEKGIFVDLCSMYWSRLGDVPFKLAVQKICGGNASALQSLCDNNICEVIDGNIYIKFLSEQLSEFDNISERNSRIAKEAWEKRRKQKEESERNASVLQSQSERNAIREDKIRENKIIVNNIIDRKQTFLEELKPFVEVYGKDMMNEFYKYWTEDNKSGTKFKMELEKTWDTKKRLERWDKNNFTKKTQTEVKPIYKPLDK